MTFAVLLGNGIALRLEEHAADRSGGDREEDDGCCIVGDDIVHAADSAGLSEVVRHAKNQQVEGTGCEDQKASEYKKVERAGDAIARVLPLPKPELQQFLRTKPGAVEADIALRVNEWCNTFCDDVGEARQSQELQRCKQIRGWNLPVDGLGENGYAIDHNPCISTARVALSRFERSPSSRDFPTIRRL